MMSEMKSWKATCDFLVTGSIQEGSLFPAGEPVQGSVSGCLNDAQAVAAWLGDSTPNTWTSYRKTAYRFMSWLHCNKRKCLGELDFSEWLEYEAFLRNIPSDWQSRSPTAFGDFDKGYRFFKGSLDERSIIQEKRAISSLFSWLSQTGYIGGNPFLSDRRRSSGQSTSARLRSFAGHTKKAIEEESFEVLSHFLKTQAPSSPVGLAKHARLVFILNSIYYSGLRVSELCELRTNTERMILMNTGDDWPNQITYTMVVVGKGGKIRELPMHSRVKNSFFDMREKMGLPMATKDYEDLPVLMSVCSRDITSRKLIMKRMGEDSGFREHLKMNRRSYQGINRQAVFKILKNCYSEFSQWLTSAEASVYGVSAEQAERISANMANKHVHSLRHSFGTNIVRHNGIGIASKLLGHSCPATTLNYVSVGDKESYDALSKIK